MGFEKELQEWMDAQRAYAEAEQAYDTMRERWIDAGNMAEQATEALRAAVKRTALDTTPKA